MRGTVLLLCLFTAIPNATAAEPAPPRGLKIGWNAGISGALALTLLATRFVPPPSTPRWQGAILADDAFRQWLEQPTEAQRSFHSDISDVGVVINTTLPIASFAIVALASRKHQNRAFANRALVATQAVLGSTLLTWIAKTAVARQRPIAEYGNESFFSGHSTSMLAAGLLFGEASPFAGEELAVWRYTLGSTALAVAVTTATLRMSAGRHYFSDVFVGAGVGFFFC